MSKSFLVLIFLLSLNLSHQLDCGDYDVESCGTFNSGFSSKCFVDGTCKEMKVDSGCKIDAENNCVKENNSNSKEYCQFYDETIKGTNTQKICKRYVVDDSCEVDNNFNCEANTESKANSYCLFDSGKNNCKKFQKTCTMYNTDTCGGLNELSASDKKQCIQLSSNSNCKEIEIDEYCKVVVESTVSKCVSRKDFDSSKFICDFIYDEETPSEIKECKRRDKVCKDQDLDSCQEFNAKCYKIQGNENCIEVEVNNKCKINENACANDDTKIDSDIESCQLTKENNLNKCTPIYKQCEGITNVEKCQYGLVNGNNNCVKLTEKNSGKCTEVHVDSGCKLDSDNACQIQQQAKNNKCEYPSTYISGILNCIFYEIDNECKITDAGNCEYDSTDNTPIPEGKICAFDDVDKTKCLYRNTKCSDFTTETDCEGKTLLGKQNSICSWYSSTNTHICKEFEIYNSCTVTKDNGCTVKDGTLGENKACLFNDYTETKCLEKTDTCENYYTGCSSKGKTNEFQCIQTLSNENCKKIAIDEDCEVDTDNSCETKSGGSISNTEKCYYNSDQTECKKGTKKCVDYQDNSCNNLDNCVYFDTLKNIGTTNQCFETQIENANICKIDESKNCIKASDNSISENEVCEFIYDDATKKAICKKRTKLCNEYTEDECNSIKTNGKGYQCFYFGSSCNNYTIDGFCKMSSESSNLKCVEDGTNKITDNEICDFSGLNKQGCEKREKYCSDLNTNDCTNYNPVSKTCFYVENKCKEIKVDSQCKINDEGKCVNNGCSYNTEKTQCTYKDTGAGSLLQIKRLALLAVFFMF